VYIYFVFFRCIDVSLQVQYQNNNRQFQFCVSDHSDHVIASWHYWLLSDTPKGPAALLERVWVKKLISQQNIKLLFILKLWSWSESATFRIWIKSSDCQSWLYHNCEPYVNLTFFYSTTLCIALCDENNGHQFILCHNEIEHIGFSCYVVAYVYV